MSDDTLQHDWDWILKVLKMTTDRVEDGQCITIPRPKGWPKSADIKWTMEDAVVRQVRTIIRNAEVVDAD